MPNARRFALSALLVVGSAALAGLLASLSTPRYAGARVPPAADLPWPPAVTASDRQLPFSLLYVDSRCSHCSRAAALLDSIATARGFRAVVVAPEDSAAATEYRRHLGLHLPIATDSSSRLIHAIGTGSVPTLVLFHADGSRQLVVGFTRDAPYRRVLAEFAK